MGHTGLNPAQQLALLVIELGLREQALIAQIGQLLERLLEVACAAWLGLWLRVGRDRLRIEVAKAMRIVTLGLQHGAFESERMPELAHLVDPHIRSGQDLDRAEI